jgi:hypothetical protein
MLFLWIIAFPRLTKTARGTPKTMKLGYDIIAESCSQFKM